MSKTVKRIPPGFKTPAKNFWKRAWESPTVTEADYDSIILVCQLLDERAEMNAWFKDHPRFLLINNNTNVILHPYIKRIESIDKQTESLLNALGLTPFGRSKLGLAVEAEENNPFNMLMEKWAKEEAEQKESV